MDVCTNPEILKVLKFLSILIDIVKFMVPIGLIVIGMLDFAKSVIANDDSGKKNVSLFIKRLIYAMVIFLVPTIVNFVIVFLGDLAGEINYTDCLNNIANLPYYEQLAAEKKAKEEEEEKAKREQARLENQENISIKNYYSSGGLTDGTYIGQKYDLTERQLKAIAMMAQKEQGSVEGAKAEATLIANRFELYGSKYGAGSNGLYNYLRNCKWWSNPGKYMDDEKYIDKNLKTNIKTAVYEVLVLGKRTLPPYVNEHDCIHCGSGKYDVVKIFVNGRTITDKNELVKKENYIKDETRIVNRYMTHDEHYVFYTFPGKGSDPFGYTPSAKRKVNEMMNK